MLLTILPLTGLDRSLAYAVPEAMQAQVTVGSLVRIPLLNRTELGVVKQIGSKENVPAKKIKFILEVLYPTPVLDGQLIQLGQWMQRYYAATAETVFETMIPAAVRQQTAPKMRSLLEVRQILPDDEMAKLEKRAPKQAELYRFLQQQIKPLPKSMVLNRLKVNAASCDTLVKKGLVREFAEREERVVYADDLAGAETVAAHEVQLNEEQQAAADDFRASLSANEFRPHLLHGVTGSGKTEVYLDAMRAVMQQGGGCIFLVPEVALTPQTVSRLRARLERDGAKIVVWHSHLSVGERFDAWFALAKGEAQVVVGARSAIFAPVHNLRLVVVDEEHEPAYKQGETPRYHGRDVAVYRAMLAGATCILGSATPSLESLYNVQQKRYRLNRLTKRVDDRSLPTVHIVDMRREKLRTDGLQSISQTLADKLIDRFEKKEQSILFLNRRGYSNSVLCPECGFTPECPHCAVTLTYHKTDDRIKCHICGYFERLPPRCPKCGSGEIRKRGAGTQRIEEAVQRIVPRAKIVRLDTDTMTKKNLFRHILSDFRAGKIDILVGTQMIAKGLDFPNVTLVGMVDADISLHVPDFRASERCFQLLVQVSGRAGRGDLAGEVIVQTYMPHHEPIQFARRGDFDGYLEVELEQRREFHYPPFRHIVRHLFRGRNPDKVIFYAEKWADLLEEKLEHPVEIRGPAPAPLEKIKDTYRYHIWYFLGNVSKVLPAILKLRKEFPMDEEVIDVFDVDPVDMV
ncbi:replication restart helicase PriA [Cerasicoccus frondis]|uniref:replication restart helicase PriA n=1 Tax=Cerasicoccus frondis TaxID=490090 RepID=UPI002852A6DE|nr:primosomal protein N' [Cerasicoccus frondis]